MMKGTKISTGGRLACILLLLTQISALLQGSTPQSMTFMQRIRSVRRSSAVQCSSSAVSDEKTRKFLDWADTEGIKAPKCQISKFPGGLRGIGALEDFADDFFSVSVPAELVIQTNNNRPPSPFLDFCSEKFWSEKCKWDHRLALKLIYEIKGFDEKAIKKPWLDKLPESFSTPLHWSNDEIQKTQYSALSNKVEKQSQDWKTFYSLWSNHIENSPKMKKISYDEFVWSMECVNSRAFSGIYEGSSASERRGLYLFTGALTLLWPLAGLGTAEQSLGAAVLVAISIISKDFFFSRAAGLKRYVICPYIDMFNHKSTCSSDVSYGYFSDTFELKTQGYKKGEQIFISYGKQSNDRLLQYYGFTDLKNPYDLYDFGVNFLELILKYADSVNEVVAFPSVPGPQERLKEIAVAMQSTVVEDTKDLKGKDKNVLSLSSGDDKTTRYFKTVTNSAGLVSHFDDISVRSMRALYATTEEWNKLVKESGGINELKSLNNVLPLSAETEKKVFLAFQSMIQFELNEKETSVEEDEKLLLEYENSRSKNTKKNSKIEKSGKMEKMEKSGKGEKNDENKKGFSGKEKEIVLDKIAINKKEFDVDPSGYYSDGEFAALNFRIEKKKILLDALEKSQN